jgi:CBS domain-containing protein
MNRSIVTATPDEDLFSCTRKMVKSGVRQLPVVENSGLVGIISSTDVLSSFVENRYNPVKKRVQEVMTSDVVYCEQDDELSRIWDKMYSSGFSGFPVLKKGRVIGMVTRSDIMKEGSVRLSKESGKTKVVPVKRAIKTPAITATIESRIEDIAKTMIDNKIIRLPVTDREGRLLGIVDVEDILRAYVG